MGLASPSPSTTPSPSPSGYIVLQRPFQNVGELGYAYNPIIGQTLDFKTSGSPAAALLDFFTYNTTDNTATYNLPYPLRAGPVNVNTKNAPVLAAILTGALPSETPMPAGVVAADANTAATSIVASTSATPAMNRQDIARLASVVTNVPLSTNEETEKQ